MAEILLIIAIWESPIVPKTLSYCEQNKDAQTTKENCSTYDVTLVTIWKGGKFLDDHNGAIIAIFTVVLAGFTVRLAVATDRLVKQSDETARWQLRAYVGVASVAVVNTSGKETVAIKIKNFGQTPAYRCGINFDVIVSDYPLQQNVIPAACVKDTGSKDTLWPGREGRTSVPIENLTDIRLESIKTGRSVVLLVGCIEYFDAFAIRRQTNVRMTCRGIGWDEGVMDCEPEGNDST